VASVSVRLSARHVVLTTIGTDGDVFPYLALGSHLRERGYRVTLVTSAAYADLAAQRGLEFEPLVSVAEISEWFAHPHCWHPLRGPAIGARFGVKFLDRQYELLSRLVGTGDSVLVSHPGVLSARIVHDRLSTPMATMLLQPWTIQSNIEPPQMPRMTLPRGWPDWAGHLYWRMVDALGDRMIGREINALRQRLGLSPIRRVFRWWLSPQCVIGLFPDWYGPPQRDWPAQIRVTGFPLNDGLPGRELPASVAKFMEAGDPPVAFTFGTGMQHASRLFAACLEACRQANVRGLFLTKHPEQLPQSLPSFACHAAFAPFRTLFPRCAAVTHHGGIGTTSQALAAGVPQLIVPFAFDQFDNGVRLKRLGVGDWCGLRRRNAGHIAAALQRLMVPEVRERCRIQSERIEENGLDAAADQVESLFPSDVWAPQPHVTMTKHRVSGSTAEKARRRQPTES
jgi:rhamnosyltransferase subunit B